MSDRRARRQQAVRTKIRTAMLELFEQKEIDEISIKELSDKADIARRTLYAYYPSKEAIISDIVCGGIKATVEKEYGEAETLHQTFKDRLHHVIQAAVKRRKNFGDFERRAYKVGMAYEASNHSADSQFNTFRQSKDYFQRWISDGQATGELKTGFTAEFLAVSCIGVLFNINQHWMNHADYPHIERHHQAEAFLYDLLTD